MLEALRLYRIVVLVSPDVKRRRFLRKKESDVVLKDGAVSYLKKVSGLFSALHDFGFVVLDVQKSKLKSKKGILLSVLGVVEDVNFMSSTLRSLGYSVLVTRAKGVNRTNNTIVNASSSRKTVTFS